MDPYQQQQQQQYYAHRSRSQSRFPPDDFPTLDESYRSKSVDNRHHPLGGGGGGGHQHPYETQTRQSHFEPEGQHPAHHQGGVHHQGGGGGEFFNDSITIPIQHLNPGGHGGHSAHSQSQAHGLSHAQRSRDETHEMNYGAEEGEFTTYDRSIKYSQEHTDFPSARQYYHHEYASNRLGAGGGGMEQMRAVQAPPSDYVAATQESAAGGTVRGSSTRHTKHTEYTSRTAAAAAAADSHRHGMYDRHREADEYAGGMSTFGRSAAARSAAGGGGRSYHHHREYHQQSGGGGGGRAAYGYGQQNMANGGGWSHTSAKGGWFGRGKRSASGGVSGGPPKPVVHRRIRCCCFSFNWPPWSYEEVAPPRPWFYSPPPKDALGPRFGPPNHRDHQGPPSTIHPINTSTLPPPGGQGGLPHRDLPQTNVGGGAGGLQPPNTHQY